MTGTTVIAFIIVIVLWLYVTVARQTYRVLIAQPDVQDGIRELDKYPGKHTSGDVRRLAVLVAVAWPWMIVRELIKRRAQR